MLRHTTEEILAACIEAFEPTRAALTSHLRELVVTDLEEGLKKHSWFAGFDIKDELPVKFSLEQWIKKAKEVDATVFIAGVVSNRQVLILSTFVLLVHFSIPLRICCCYCQVPILGMCSSSPLYECNYNGIRKLTNISPSQDRSLEFEEQCSEVRKS